MNKHTPGPLRLFQVGDNLEFLCPATEDGESILTITHEGNTAFAVVLSDINARRLVACWNACDGIRTEALEHRAHLLKAENDQLAMLNAQRDELLEALKQAIAWIEGDRTPVNALANARAIIAKATGETA